jgi:hypothetical protein
MSRRNRVVVSKYVKSITTPEDVIEIKKQNKEKLDWILKQPIEWLIERAKEEYGSNWMCIFAGEKHFLHDVKYKNNYNLKKDGLLHPMKANRSRKIQKIDSKTNELVCTYENAKECQELEGLSNHQISTVLSVCTKKMTHYKGHLWKFEDEEEYFNQLKNYEI